MKGSQNVLPCLQLYILEDFWQEEYAMLFPLKKFNIQSFKAEKISIIYLALFIKKQMLNYIRKMQLAGCSNEFQENKANLTGR